MPSNISNAQGDRNPIEGDLLDRTDRRKPFFRRVALVLVIAAAVLFADALFLEAQCRSR